jgi:hypothetical protein
MGHRSYLYEYGVRLIQSSPVVTSPHPIPINTRPMGSPPDIVCTNQWLERSSGTAGTHTLYPVRGSLNTALYRDCLYLCVYACTYALPDHDSYYFSYIMYSMCGVLRRPLFPKYIHTYSVHMYNPSRLSRVHRALRGSDPVK